MKTSILRFILAAALMPLALTSQVTALRVGHLVDPENGTVADNQVVLVENGRFTAIGGNVGIPAGAEVVDLSQYWVTQGLVRENPLENIDTLRDVRAVMKDGMFFKRDGVMTPEKFLHSGPTPPTAWRP